MVKRTGEVPNSNTICGDTPEEPLRLSLGGLLQVKRYQSAVFSLNRDVGNDCIKSSQVDPVVTKLGGTNEITYLAKKPIPVESAMATKPVPVSVSRAMSSQEPVVRRDSTIRKGSA